MGFWTQIHSNLVLHGNFHRLYSSVTKAINSFHWMKNDEHCIWISLFHFIYLHFMGKYWMHKKHHIWWLSVSYLELFSLIKWYLCFLFIRFQNVRCFSVTESLVASCELQSAEFVLCVFAVSTQNLKFNSIIAFEFRIHKKLNYFLRSWF